MMMMMMMMIYHGSNNNNSSNIFFNWRDSPQWGQSLLIHKVSRSHTTMHHSQEGSSGRVISPSQRLYLTTHNAHNRQTSIPPLGFETAISAGMWPQAYALDRTATGIDINNISTLNISQALSQSHQIWAPYQTNARNNLSVLPLLGSHHFSGSFNFKPITSFWLAQMKESFKCIVLWYG